MRLAARHKQNDKYCIFCYESLEEAMNHNPHFYNWEVLGNECI